MWKGKGSHSDQYRDSIYGEFRHEIAFEEFISKSRELYYGTQWAEACNWL